MSENIRAMPLIQIYIPIIKGALTKIKIQDYKVKEIQKHLYK